MIISTEAKNQYNDVIKAYVKAYLYSFDDVYIDELQVINYSYNFSREFGTSILNLEVTYDDSIIIEQDQIVVLIEGFDTTVANDKLPKFKGRITIIDDTETADNNTLRLQVYDEISLLQRSEFDGRLTGQELSASNITLTPVVINPLGQVVDTVYGSRIRIGYNGNLELNSLVTTSPEGKNSIYIEDNHYSSKIIDYPVKVINNEPHIYYSDLVGSFSTNDIIRNESGSFKATYKSAISFSRGIQHTPVQANVGGNMVITYTKSAITETLIKLTTNPEGTPIHNEKLYKEVAGVIDVNNYFTVKSFYELDAYKFTNNFPIEMDNILIGDKIHNGMVSFFRAPNPNWSSFSAHKLFLRRKGNITDEDFDDAYDVNYEKGIIKLNTPVNITQLDVIATYKYIEKGLKAEDVLRDIIIADDEYREDVISVGGYDFSNYTNMDTGKYSISKGNVVNIQTLDDMSASNYLGISQVVDINDSLNFEYIFSANVGIEGDMKGKLYIKHDSETPTSYSLASTVTPTLTFNKTTSTTIYLYVSGCSNNTKLTISDTKLTKRNSVIFQFSKANLYSTIKKEKKLNAVPNYSLLKNSIVYSTPLYSYLVDDLDITDTTIYLSDATDFETEGYLTIGEEVIHYTSKSGNNLSGLTRGTNGTVTSNHVSGNRGYETMSASRVWLMEYNNIIPKTDIDTASDYDASIGVNVLSASSFTIDGSTFKKAYYREGLVITNAQAKSVTLTANNDYLFNQLQSTGIEFPYVVIDGKNYGNRMDAINEIRTAIAPNYVVRGAVRVDGSNYITYIKGSYLNQKTTQDNDTLGVISITNNINNENYNRVKMYGRLDNPINIMYNDGVKVYTFSNNEEVYVKGVAYAYVRQDGNYYVYETLQSNTIGNKFISWGNPIGKAGDYTLYLDNKLQGVNLTYKEEVVGLGGEEHYKTILRQTNELIYVKLYRKRMNVYNAYIAETDNETVRVLGTSQRIKAGEVAFEKTVTGTPVNVLKLTSKNDSNYVNSVSNNWTEFTLKTTFDDGNYVYYQPGNVLGDAIGSATHIRYFSVSGDIRYELNRDKIYINKDDLKKITNDPRGLAVRVDGNFQFGVDETFTNSEVPAIERLRNMGVDQEGKLEQIGFASRGPIEELPLFVVDMAKNTSISYLDIQGGYFYKPEDDTNYDVTFDITIRHCDKDVDYSLLTDADFEEINDKFVKQSVEGGKVKTFTSEDFGDRFTTRYLKIYVGCSEKPVWTNKATDDKRLIEYWGAGIAGLAIYSDDVLVSEAGIDAKVINLYKDTKVYEQLNTQSLLDRIVQIKLNEFQKNNNNVDVALLYGPQFEVGDTVYVPQRTQNYFVEEVASTNGNTTLKLSYYS